MSLVCGSCTEREKASVESGRPGLRVSTTGGERGLLHVLGGSGSDGPGVELADDEVDHRDEVAVGAVPTGSAFRGLDQRVEALQESV